MRSIQRRYLQPGTRARRIRQACVPGVRGDINSGMACNEPVKIAAAML
jgi:hypothetical protein